MKRWVKLPKVKKKKEKKEKKKRRRSVPLFSYDFLLKELEIKKKLSIGD
jgi:DNA-binding helix-hairpin-helix protein with protein kinase domain